MCPYSTNINIMIAEILVIDTLYSIVIVIIVIVIVNRERSSRYRDRGMIQILNSIVNRQSIIK